jgi:hypothetical protein
LKMGYLWFPKWLCWWENNDEPWVRYFQKPLDRKE